MIPVHVDEKARHSLDMRFEKVTEATHGEMCIRDSPGTVDLALLSQALHHAQKPVKALEAAWNILKPGGCLLYTSRCV